jgi:probable phosphoglycerate mutase
LRNDLDAMSYQEDNGQVMLSNATEKSLAHRRRVYLMRHGEVDYFDAAGRPYRPDTVSLNAEGQHQAHAAGRVLAGVPLDRAIASGLARTVETARLVLQGHNIPLEHEPRLREIETGRMSEWAGATPADVERAILGALPQDLHAGSRFLAGETFGSCRERVLGCWAEIVAQPDWRNLLIVAHGMVNRLLLSNLLGADFTAVGVFEQDAGCLNLIEVDPTGRCLVRLVNFTPARPVKEGLELTTLEMLYRQYCQGRSPPPA